MVSAHESIAALMAEQKRLRKQKVPGARGLGKGGGRLSRKGLGEACGRSETWALRPQIPCDFESFSSAGLPGGSDGKESACSAGDPSSIPWLGRSPGVGNGNPLQYSCLENPHGRRRLAGHRDGHN